MISSKWHTLKKEARKGLLKAFITGKISKKVFNVRKAFVPLKGNYAREIVDDNKTMTLLKKEYSWYLNSNATNYTTNKKLNKTIWWSWLQGYDFAPPLVKMCLKSVKYWFSDYEIKIISQKNLSDYIDIPNIILKKYHAGIITNAAFSDIIRVMLLAKFGGVWIDSTVFCSNGKIKSVIENTDFFAYQNDVLSNNSDIKISSWFLSAKKGDPIINEEKKLLLNYWENNNYLKSYFIIHLLFTLVATKYPVEWSKIPCFNNVSPHMMVKELNNKYNKNRYTELDSFSSLHKLNHHLKFDDSKNTLYHHLLGIYHEL